MNRSGMVIGLLALALPLFTLPGDAGAEGETGEGYESYAFEREIRLAPGESYAVSYDPARREFVEVEPDRGYAGLPERALKQVLRAPLWLREKLADRLVDLYREEINVGGDASAAFGDVDGDGERDLVVGNGDGEVRCFLAPHFSEDKEILAHVKVPGRAVPVFYRVPGRGAKRYLVVGNASGRLQVWEGAKWDVPSSDVAAGLFSGQVYPCVRSRAKGDTLHVIDDSGSLWDYDPVAGVFKKSEKPFFSGD